MKAVDNLADYRNVLTLVSLPRWPFTHRPISTKTCLCTTHWKPGWLNL